MGKDPPGAIYEAVSMNPTDSPLGIGPGPTGIVESPADRRSPQPGSSPEFARIFAEAQQLASAEAMLKDSPLDAGETTPSSGEDQLASMLELANMASSLGGQRSATQPTAALYPGMMERLLRSRSSIAAPNPASRANPAPSLSTPAQTAPDAEGSQHDQKSGFNSNRFVAWMDSHALSRSAHHCAMFVRRALEAAGLGTSDRPRSGDAGDFDPYLQRHGAQVVAADKSYIPQPGDTAVFAKTGQHPHGHIEVFDGTEWVSDFRQRSFSPYRDVESTPPVTVYRIS